MTENLTTHSIKDMIIIKLTELTAVQMHTSSCLQPMPRCPLTLKLLFLLETGGF